MLTRRRLSVLVPAYNEELNVERAYRAISDVLATLPDYDGEIIFTDNHSADRTWELIVGIAARDPRVRALRFSRNVGYERSLLMAYQAATGDCSVQIDCDLQDPPELIPQMLELWEAGYKVVYGVRRSLAEPLPLQAVRRMFYAAMHRLSHDELPVNAGEFRLVDRCILAELRKVEDTSPYVRGLISAMGFAQVGFAYDRRARVAGESKFPLLRMISLALDGLLNHSLVPLRIASLTGLFVGFAMLLLLLGYIAGRFVFGQDWPAGFATTTVLLLFSITLNALFLGILGEYVGRIFMQAKRRPLPIVEATLGRPLRSAPAELPEPLREATR